MMDVEEMPYDEDDSDLVSSEEVEDNYVENKLDGEKLKRFQHEQMMKIEQEIQMLKNINIQQSVKPLDLNDNTCKFSVDKYESQKLLNGNGNTLNTPKCLESLKHKKFQEDIPETDKTMSKSSNFDEVPVCQSSCKNFNDLLEKVMTKVEILSPTNNSGPIVNKKREFLRKGKGLERFNLKKKESDELDEKNSALSQRATSETSKSSGEGILPTTSSQQIKLTDKKKPAVCKSHPKTTPAKKVLILKKPDAVPNTVSCQTKHSPKARNLSPVTSSSNVHGPEMDKKSEQTGSCTNDRPKTQSREQNFGMNETQPLNEFEILEEYAMEDASFLSSISAVDKILHERHGMPSKDGKLLSQSNSRDVSSEKNHSKPVEVSSLKATAAYQNVSKNVLTDLARVDFKRNSSKENMLGKLDEQPRVESSVDSSLDFQRGKYVPSLYAPAGNDDTFSNDAIWEPSKGDFEDDVAWNDSTMKSDTSARRHEVTKNDSRGNPNLDCMESKVLPSLVSKIFPASNHAKDSPVAEPQRPPERGLETNHSKILQQKILELDVEIEKYKLENASLVQAKRELSKGAASLKKEVEEFQKKRLAEEEEFERMKSTEKQKLQKERKLFEAYKKSHEDLFYARDDKKSQEALKTELEKSKDEMKLKEQRWKANSERMSNRIEQLEKENLDLKGKLFSKEQELLKAKNQIETLRELNKKKPQERHSLEQSYMTNRKAASIPNPPCLVRSSLDSNIPSPIVSKIAESVPNANSMNGHRQSSGSSVDEVFRQQNMPDGSIKICYAKVAKRIQNQDGSETIFFVDGDTQQNYPDGRKLYTFTEHGIQHLSHPDGLQIFRFPCGQVEKIFADGNKEISFPNGNLKYVYPDGSEETILQDGSVVKVFPDGLIVKELADGTKETYAGDARRIEYPDKTVKIIQKDGSQKTHYVSGRVRMKDPEGNLIYDGFKNC